MTHMLDTISTCDGLDDHHADISQELHRCAHLLASLLLDVEMPRDSFAQLAQAFIERERRHMSEEETVIFSSCTGGTHR